MPRKLRRLLELAPLERRLLLEAWLWLLAAGVAMRLRPLPGARTLLARFASLRAGAPAAVSPERLHRLVAIAGRHHLASMRCLPRSLALEAMLLRRGLRPVLRIGVQRGGNALHAHAWLEHDGRPLGDDAAAAGRFAPLVGGTGA